MLYESVSLSNLSAVLKEKIAANPPGLYVLFYTQMWELFGRFSITALLILYLTKSFHIPDSEAFTIYSTFIALLFGLPILGGYLADRYLGGRRAVLLGASIMAIGNTLLVVPVKEVVLVGLAIIAIGSGFFLPSIPPLVSAIYEHDDKKRDAGFTLYYLGTNVGALLGPILCGFVGQHYGLNYAFLLSTIGMFSGIIVFLRGQKHLEQLYRLPTVPFKLGVWFSPQLFIYLGCAFAVPFFLWVIQKDRAGFLLILAGIVVVTMIVMTFLRSQKKERRNLMMIILTLLAVIVFESFLGQGGTTLNLFIDRLVNRHFFGITLPTSFFYALDPTFMLIMGPILASVWVRLAKKNKEPFVMTKFAMALIVLALGFLVFVCAALSVKITGKAPLFFIVFAYFLFPIAELCIIPISLSLVTRLAPRGLASVLVGVWMLSNAASGYLTGLISKLGQINFSLNTCEPCCHDLFALVFINRDYFGCDRDSVFYNDTVY